MLLHPHAQYKGYSYHFQSQSLEVLFRSCYCPLLLSKASHLEMSNPCQVGRTC